MGCGASTTAQPEPALRDPLYNAAPEPVEEVEAAPLAKYAAEPASTAAADDLAQEATETAEPDIDPLARGLELSFAAPGGTGGSITHRSTASGLVDNLGSLLPTPAQGVMSKVDLGQLHEKLQGMALVTEEQFGSAIKSLLPGADAPPDSTITALFRAFDADRSGEVDQKELVAGCQALCSGDDDTKLRLAFSCFDADGDGHLTADELKLLVRGTIEPAVAQLHAAIDFASFSAEGDAADIEAINEEAAGAAALTTTEGGSASIRVELATRAGKATISVPAASLSASGLDVNAISLDAFLEALVSDAMSKYDADHNGTIEKEEFVAFARENAFLATWFGHLAQSDGREKSSWKDDFMTS